MKDYVIYAANIAGPSPTRTEGNFLQFWQLGALPAWPSKLDL